MIGASLHRFPERNLMTSPAPTTSAAQITTVDAPALRHRIATDKDLPVIDVRSSAEFEALHIAGSYNVPLPLLTEHTEQVAARLGRQPDQPVVLVCQSGVRAEQARRRLAAVGIDTAVVLAGGVPGYAAAGGDVVRGAVRWSLDRQVRLVAGSLVVLGLVGGRFVSPKVRTLAGAIGTGLTFSAVTDTCAMGRALSVMPWNTAVQEPTVATALAQLPTGARTPEGRAS